MKTTIKGFKKVALSAVAVLAAVPVFAQSQGYKDGIEYYEAGQFGNAKTILSRTLNDAQTDKALANYYLGMTELSLKDINAAKSYFQQGLKINPQDPFNMVGMGAIALQNGNAEEAKALFKDAQKLAKKNSALTVAIARSYYMADPVKYAKEIQDFLKKAHKDSKNEEPAIYILEGDMDMDAEKWGDAAAKYENAMLYDGNNPAAYVKYATSYFKVNPEFAIKKLEEFLYNSPNSALAQRELAEKHYLADRWNKAAELYGKYIQNPNHFPEDKARYAVLLYYGNKFPESLQVAQEVLKTDPSNFVMQRLLFLNKAKMNNPTEAAAEAERFFTNNPGGNFATNDYETYANVLGELGQDSLAVIQYELAVKNDPENLDLLKELCSRYSTAKQYGPAAEIYSVYLSKLEEPTANDYFNAAGRYLNAAASASNDQADFKKNMAAKGLEYIDKAIAVAQPNADLYKYKARLNIAGNLNTPNQEAIEAYDKMMEILDQDPAAKDINNENNQLPLYREAYQFNFLFYKNVAKDEEKAKEFITKFKETNDLINGVTTE